jgi:hypothetical protein
MLTGSMNCRKESFIEFSFIGSIILKMCWRQTVGFISFNVFIFPLVASQEVAPLPSPKLRPYFCGNNMYILVNDGTIRWQHRPALQCAPLLTLLYRAVTEVRSPSCCLRTSAVWRKVVLRVLNAFVCIRRINNECNLRWNRNERHCSCVYCVRLSLHKFSSLQRVFWFTQILKCPWRTRRMGR